MADAKSAGVDVSKLVQNEAEPSAPDGSDFLDRFTKPMARQPEQDFTQRLQPQPDFLDRMTTKESTEINPELYTPSANATVADRYLGPLPAPTTEEYLKGIEPSPADKKKVTTSTDPYENALMPFREWGKNWWQETKESAEAMRGQGPVMSALGAFGIAYAPISSAWKSFVGDPVRRVTGSDTAGELAEAASDMAIVGGIPGLGKRFLKSVADLGLSIKGSRPESIRKLADMLDTLRPQAMEGADKVQAASEMLRKAAASGTPVPPRMVAKVVDSVAPPEGKFGQWYGNVWEVIEWPFKQKVIPTREGKKSVQQIFQPAVERLESSGLDQPFRLGRAKKQLAMRAGEELGKDLQGLTPQERLDVMRGLRGGDTTTDAGKAAVVKFNERLKDFDLGREYHEHFNTNLRKQLDKIDLPELDDPQLGPMVDNFLKSVQGSFEGKTKPHEIMGQMEQLLADPGVTPHFKRVLKDLYNLPASTPAAVAKASDRAAKGFMLSGLKERGAIATEPAAGLRLVGKGELTSFPGLRGKFVPDDVYFELKAWQDVSKFSHHALNKWFMSPWKTSKVVLRPATHVRNIFSNLMLNDLGGLPVYDIGTYAQAWREFRDKGKIWKEYRNLTGAGGTFTANDIMQVGEGLKLHQVGGAYEHAGMADRMLAYFDSNKVVSGMRNLYNAEEQLFKLAKYIKNRKGGMDNYEAALDAMKWTHNYGEVTRATAAIRSTAMPFFTWQSKIMPLMAEVAKKHPMRLAKWFAGYEAMQMGALNGLNMNSDEWQYMNQIMPSYIADGQFLMMPFRDEKQRLQALNLTYMVPGFGDINQFMNDPVSTIVANPLVSIAGGLGANRTFTGAPIYYEWEEPTTKAAKAMSYVWGNLAPSWVPGGQDQLWSKIGQGIEDHPDAPTWYQILGQEMGFKIHTIDESQATRKKQALERMQLSELQTDFLRKMREAGKAGKSDQTMQDIAERFALLRQRLRQPKESSGPTAQLLRLTQ